MTDVQLVNLKTYPDSGVQYSYHLRLKLGLRQRVRNRGLYGNTIIICQEGPETYIFPQMPCKKDLGKHNITCKTYNSIQYLNLFQSTSMTLPLSMCQRR